jgi:ABC-2 type transport system permease protein
MDFEIAWTIARKDLGTVRKKKSILYATVILPLILSIALPALMWYAEQRRGSISAIQPLLHAFPFIFVIIGGFIPAGIASYSIVGEKVEKSLEPLLSTPATDGEILVGKSLAALIPALISAYIGLSVFMVLADAVTFGQLGYLYYPNSTIAVIIAVVVPLAILISVGFNVIISSKVSDVRTATQLGALGILPFAVIYLASEIGIISLDTDALLYISLVLLVVALVLLYLSKTTFRREEILTKWK